MKKLLFLLLLPFMLLVGISCFKETAPQLPVPEHFNITGQWKWVESMTGWGGFVLPGADSVVTLTLSPDSLFMVALNDEVRSNGHFSTFMSPTQDSTMVLQFDRSFTVYGLRFKEMESIWHDGNDSCRFYDYLIADGSSHLFIRIR